MSADFLKSITFVLFFGELLDVRCGEVRDLLLCDVDRYVKPNGAQHVIDPRPCRHYQLPALKHAPWRENLQVKQCVCNVRKSYTVTFFIQLYNYVSF